MSASTDLVAPDIHLYLQSLGFIAWYSIKKSNVRSVRFAFTRLQSHTRMAKFTSLVKYDNTSLTMCIVVERSNGLYIIG